MRKNTIWQIDLIATAPDKPQEGNACNGCGICCAYILCPAARVRFLKESGPCVFLKWQKERYICQLIPRPFLLFPKKFRTLLWFLPKNFRSCFYRFLKHQIANALNISKGCDCSIAVIKE